MTERQKKALAGANKALKELHKSGILICGMDDILHYATVEAANQYSVEDMKSSGGNYNPVARACQFGDADTGALYSGGYVDSGGW